MTRPHCAVSLRHNPGTAYHVDPAHYERLRDQLDHGDTGWIELTLATHPSGKAFVRLEDICELSLAPADYCAAVDADKLTESL